MLKHGCHRCQKIFDGEPCLAPGPSIGNFAPDQIVCPPCFDAHAAFMEQHFWKGAAAQPPHMCARCGEALSPKECGLAHHEVVAGRKWTRETICLVCYGEYLMMCTVAMKP